MSSNCGGQHTFFLTESGKLYAMGKNEKGQLGLGHTNTVYEPVLVPYTSFPGMTPEEKVLEIATGKDHTIILVGRRFCPNDCKGDNPTPGSPKRGDCNEVLGKCYCFSQFFGPTCGLAKCPTHENVECAGHGVCNTKTVIFLRKKNINLI